MEGQNRKKGKCEAVEMDDQKGKTSGSDREEAASLQIDVHDNIEEPFDEEFWHKVRYFTYYYYQMNTDCKLKLSSNADGFGSKHISRAVEVAVFQNFVL